MTIGPLRHGATRRTIKVYETGNLRHTGEPTADKALVETSAPGRVPPATSLAREAAVQRTAGIQYPVAVGSVRLGNERSPRLAVVGCHGWIDGRGEAAVDDVVPCINDKQVASSAALPFHRSTRRHASRRTGCALSPGSAQICRQHAQSADCPETRMDAGLRTRDLPSTRKSP